ncbi:hypothetical protein Tco_0179158 [Tanacetum coccineum]
MERWCRPPPSEEVGYQFSTFRTMEELCQPSLDEFEVEWGIDDALRIISSLTTCKIVTPSWFDRLPRNLLTLLDQMANIFSEILPTLYGDQVEK